MSVSVSVNGYSSVENPEFQKHFKAVKFCIENNLSFPKETSEFFKGRVCGDDLEDLKPEAILEYIQHGLETKLPKTTSKNGEEIRIKVSDIPKDVDVIIVKLS